MSLLDQLTRKEVWEEFLEYKISHGQLSKREEQALREFISAAAYAEPLNALVPERAVPEKKILSKMGSDKKRTVYVFAEEITWRLKLLAYLLYRYDGKLSDNCYSFRRYTTAKTAFDRIRKIPGLENKYALKADIHNYFNSIPVEPLLSVLVGVADDDPELLAFFKALLRDGRCLSDGEIIREERGAMAGVPLASFFANFYLADMDRYFEEKQVAYFRYSDDILMFGDSMEEIKERYGELREFLFTKGLSMNEKKLAFCSPEDGFEFLGFHYRSGEIDLSAATVEKMKGKIRRKARAVMRRRDEKGTSFEQAAASMIRSFDRKFYDMTGDNEFTWTRFYFPVLTSSEGLKQIDACMVQYLRYLYSGRHYKGNYAVTYEKLKRCGYTSLVHEYYTWKEDCRKLKAEAEKEHPVQSEEVSAEIKPGVY